MADFWIGKEPCWRLLDCPENIHALCPAYHNRDMPCWEHETTQCRRVLDFEWKCEDCAVFRCYAGFIARVAPAGRVIDLRPEKGVSPL